VDSLVVAGFSTSGCVRATVVDGVSLGFHAAVVADGVADRITASHKAALLDLWMKYADLVSAEESREYLSRTRSG
jgi:maleamate amidohydrolase